MASTVSPALLAGHVPGTNILVTIGLEPRYNGQLHHEAQTTIYKTDNVT
jgi:hypothetical protein